MFIVSGPWTVNHWDAWRFGNGSSKRIFTCSIDTDQPAQLFLFIHLLWKIKRQKESQFLIKSHQTIVPPCSCCVKHMYHRYWFYPWHLCCETRLLQRKRWAGNFPQCDSPLLFTEGACAQNQERKRGRAKQKGDGKMNRKYRRERERVPV